MKTFQEFLDESDAGLHTKSSIAAGMMHTQGLHSATRTYRDGSGKVVGSSAKTFDSSKATQVYRATHAVSGEIDKTFTSHTQAASALAAAHADHLNSVKEIK